MSSRTQRGILLCVFLIVSIVYTLAQDIPPMGLIVPKIAQEYFSLIPQGNRYTLRITLPDGNYRREVVELVNPNTPEQYISAKGTSYQYYKGASDRLVYTADKNGFVSKYNYGKDFDEAIEKPQIGALALKAAAG